MSKIHDEMAALAHRAAVIDFARAVANSKTPFIKSLSPNTPAAAEEVIGLVREHLLRVAEDMETDNMPEKLPALTTQDVKLLKLLASRMGVVVDEAPLTNAPKGATIKTEAKKKKIEQKPEEVKKSPYPFIASLPDISYITKVHGPLDRQVHIMSDGSVKETVVPDMGIKIIGEADEDYYTAQIPDRPEIEFRVPKDVIVQL